MRTWTVLLVTLLLAACGGSGGGGGNNGTNGTNNTSTPAGECQADSDCPGASKATFLHPDQVVCASSTLKGSYCSECTKDADCAQTGETCKDSTYCMKLKSCQTGADCAENGGTAHKACIHLFCASCTDDLDCSTGEKCYSQLCFPEGSIDASCLDASCKGTCSTQKNGGGGVTGVTCSM